MSLLIRATRYDVETEQRQTEQRQINKNREPWHLCNIQVKAELVSGYSGCYCSTSLGCHCMVSVVFCFPDTKDSLVQQCRLQQAGSQWWWTASYCQEKHHRCCHTSLAQKTMLMRCVDLVSHAWNNPYGRAGWQKRFMRVFLLGHISISMERGLDYTANAFLFLTVSVLPV